jgi:hypothetical protein
MQTKVEFQNQKKEIQIANFKTKEQKETKEGVAETKKERETDIHGSDKNPAK